MLRLWDHNIGYQSQSLAWKLTNSKLRFDRMGAYALVVEMKHELNPMGDEEEWMEKHRDMEGEEEKAMDSNTGGSPGYQSQSL